MMFLWRYLYCFCGCDGQWYDSEHDRGMGREDPDLHPQHTQRRREEKLDITGDRLIFDWRPYKYLTRAHTSNLLTHSYI